MTAKLAAPPDINLMPLPPEVPELSPAGNLWQFLCDDQPWRIMTLGMCDQAHGF